MSSFVFFGVASFFIRGIFVEPLCVFLGCLFFHRMSFFVVASFFIGGLFDEPMNEGSESTPLFVAPLVCAKVLIECQANLVGYFDLALS
jgi:hypothetical protein